jgi:hypothetical protein
MEVLVPDAVAAAAIDVDLAAGLPGDGALQRGYEHFLRGIGQLAIGDHHQRSQIRALGQLNEVPLARRRKDERQPQRAQPGSADAKHRKRPDPVILSLRLPE